jgi:YfiH family protein
MWVNHKDGIVEADASLTGVSMRDYKKAIKTDGFITNKKGLFLFLLIADCLPIIIYDPKKEVVGLIHAGWKGIDLNIAERAVKLLNEEYDSKPRDLVIAIGPFVHKSSFIKENPSQKDDPKWKTFIKRLESSGNSAYSVDLFGFTKKQLLDAGVLEDNIYESKIDTAKDKRFFSHVRDKNLPIGEQGRFACVVGLI